MLENPGEWNNETLVIYGVSNEVELESILNSLKKRYVNHSESREPDMGLSLTGIASTSRNVFNKLKLL
jgi:hypothetical protein